MLRISLAAGLLVAALTLGTSPALEAQTHILSPVSTSGVPGASVTVPILLDNSEPARGFSLGVAHDGAILTLASIAEGAALLASNGGAGPAFFIQDIAAANGPGGTCGAVLSFAAPLDDIPVGPGSEIAIYTYTVSPSALPGASSPLEVVDTLGNPVIETIISIAGVTRIPTSISGAVSVDTPPVTGVSCTLTDPCSCTFAVTWNNEGQYDEIDILEDGTLLATLVGTATSTSVSIGATTIGGPASSLLSVVARRNGVDADPGTCTASCPDVPDPIEPAGLACSIDPFTGVATLTWSNAQFYSSLTLSVDGVQSAGLGGAETTTTVTLPTPGFYTVCLDGVDECSVPFSQVCCIVLYEQVFLRGDVNVDGGFNISDPIYALNYLFMSGPMACVKAADANDSGDVNIADVVSALQGIFGVGALPPPPFVACGVDPTADLLSCDSFAICP